MKIGFIVVFLTFALSAKSQNTQITVRVLDEYSKSVSNANVKLLGDTIAATTNALGFFKLNLRSDHDTLMISSIGYVTSKVAVPRQQQFNVKLIRDYQNIVEFNLERFEHQTNIKKDTTRDNYLASSMTDRDASYPGDWQNFFNDLGHSLKSDSVKTILSEKTLIVRFAVDKNGRITQVSSANDSISIPKSIRQAFEQLQSWNPAVQNKIPTVQFFQIPLKWSTSNNKEETYVLVEQMPNPPGGMSKLMQYIASTTRYPPEARKKGVSGSVFVEFVVEKDGALSNIKVVKGLGFGCDEEAVRVFAGSPKWSPGTQRGQPVKVRMIMPIAFRIAGVTPNSQDDFYSYMHRKMEYPTTARRMGIEGIVIAKFTFDRKKGTITSSSIVHDIGGECGSTVLNVLTKIPEAVLSSLNPKFSNFILPVVFGLEKRNMTIPAYEKAESEEVLDPVFVIAIGLNIPSQINPNIPPGIPSGPMANRWYSASSVEDVLTKKPKVSSLALVNKNLITIPGSISQLKSIKYLDLEGNKLTELPEEICQLINLEGLYVPLNKLKVVPQTFPKLTSLKILGLGNNEIEKFPSEITQLQSLEVLDLSGNRISQLPVEIKNLQKLKLLSLKFNQLTSLPEEFFSLVSLERLYLEGNKFSDEMKSIIRYRLSKTEIYF